MGRHGLCKSCPLKCKWELHLNQNYHWEFQEVTETSITYEDILKKYEEAVQHKLSTEGVLQALGSELEQIKFDLKLDINTITSCLKRLDEIALRPDAFTATDYIALMIHAETKEKKPGFQEQICSLSSLLDKAKMVNKIRAGKSVIPDADEAASPSSSQSKVTSSSNSAQEDAKESLGPSWAVRTLVIKKYFTFLIDNSQLLLGLLAYFVVSRYEDVVY